MSTQTNIVSSYTRSQKWRLCRKVSAKAFTAILQRLTMASAWTMTLLTPYTTCTKDSRTEMVSSIPFSRLLQLGMSWQYTWGKTVRPPSSSTMQQPTASGQSSVTASTFMSTTWARIWPRLRLHLRRSSRPFSRNQKTCTMKSQSMRLLV